MQLLDAMDSEQATPSLSQAQRLKKFSQEHEEEKKKLYSEYQQSRKEMRELLTAKANVDRLLKMDAEQEQEKGRDHIRS